MFNKIDEKKAERKYVQHYLELVYPQVLNTPTILRYSSISHEHANRRAIKPTYV